MSIHTIYAFVKLLNDCYAYKAPDKWSIKINNVVLLFSHKNIFCRFSLEVP